MDSAAQIKLAWDPNSEPDLAGYKLYYGTSSRTYALFIDVGNVTAYAVPNLTEGVTYYFAVTAYNVSHNESAYSNEVYGMMPSPTSETVTTPHMLSGPTSGIAGTPCTYTSYGSSSILGDPVEYQFDWNGDGAVLSPWGSSTQSRTWTLPGIYNIRVRARCAIHADVISSWVGSISLTISEATLSYTITTSPPGLQITVDGTDYIAAQTFNWAAGSIHTLYVASPQCTGPGTQCVYVSWSDGGIQSHSITVAPSATTYVATLGTQYSLTTSASPSEGATVSPSGTNWYNSDQSVSLTATPAAGYSFLNWSGDLAGSDNPTFIVMSGPKSITATTKAQTGSLRVAILPQEAIGAGGQWRRVGASTWRDSETTETGIPVGPYTIEFRDISGWSKPGNPEVTISDGQAATVTGTYTPPVGSLQVVILPHEAIDAGAQWRVVGGIWHGSGDTQTNLPVGMHTVTFRKVAGWTKPGDRTVTIRKDQTITASGTYTVQTGSLRVTISPQDAISAGAQWRRVGTGTWRDSDTTETGIPVGPYTVEFKDVLDWMTPVTQTVTVSEGVTSRSFGSYAQ